jgi:outer membrane protein assembly complex protein YaeT
MTRSCRRWALSIGHWALLAVSFASTASAQVAPPIVEIQLDQEGRVVNDPAVLRLIETHVGDLLSVRSARETIAHLMSLGRYEDVQVFSEPAAGGVRVKYVLVPQHPIDRVQFTGTPGLSEDDLRRVIMERFGNAPSATRKDDVAETVRLEYRRRGYPMARVTARVDVFHDPDRATLVLDVIPGTRAKILEVKATQVDATERATITDLPNIRAGQIYDEVAIGRELQEWENRMRSRGYYEARAIQNSSISGDGSVFVFLNLELGPQVRLVFDGDPIPEDERDKLVPVRTEASADEDLLEDSQSAIESYFRTRGYRDAAAPYTRQERAGELIITFKVTRGPRYLVGPITLTGNVILPTFELRALIHLKEGEPFVRAALTTGVGAIENHYHATGFTRVQVKATDAVVAVGDRVDPDRLVNVAVAIVEGPRTEVRSVTFQGNMALTDADLRKVVSTAPGRVYSAGEVIGDRDQIVQLYRNRGYDSVTVTPRPVFAENDTRADVGFTIVEGQPIIVDHVIIAGNRRISTQTIEQEIVLRSGEPYGEAAVAQSRANLNRLELFRRVQIEALAHSGETRRDVLVQVEEAPATSVAVGGGVEGMTILRPTGVGGVAEDRFQLTPRGSFQISRRNLWGKNRSISLFTRVSLRTRDTQEQLQFDPTQPIQSSYGFHEYRVLTTYREPRVFGTSAEVVVTGIIEQDIRSSFNFSRRVIQAQVGRSLSPLYTATGAYSFQRTRLFDIRASADDEAWLIDRLFPQVRLSKFSGTLLRDSRDAQELLDPAHGSQVILTGDLAARAIGSEVGFIKTYLQTFLYRQLPVPRRTILALGARVGLAHGFSRDVNGEVVQFGLPANERFFAGGDTSVRGFATDRLGNEETISSTGFPTGGNSVVVLNSELRVNLFGPFQGIGFLDAGNVFPLASDLDFTDLRPAAGFGVAFRSARIGLVLVDLGFNLNPQEFVPGSPESRPVWHILLTHAF